MNWLFLFLLGWHPPLEIPPVPPLDWRKDDSKFILYLPNWSASDISLFLPNPKDWTLHDPDITLHVPYKPIVTKERNGWRITFKLRPVDGKK